ncbi:MAG: hypothetical protein JWP95_747, partial [Actinotalea sp.]|nr:hypothetical protein [Actinotalea sp.]
VGMDVVDAGTGETLRRLATSGAAVLNEPFGTTAVLAVLTPAGHLTVQRWDPATGELLSEVTSERPVATGGSAIVRRTERFGDILVVNGDAEVAFDLATGEEVDPADALGAGRGWEQSVRLPDGATATWTWAETGPGRGQVVEPDGTVRFDLPGPPAQPSTSDDSVPDVLLVTRDDTSLTGLDATTGEELWTTDLVGAQVVVLIDGRLVVRHGTKTIALDARDGTTLWTAETSSAGYHEGLTDGELLLTYVMGDGGSLELVALALEDGEELWRAPLPSGTQWLQADPYGGVVGVTMASVFRLGDPGPWTPSDARG